MKNLLEKIKNNKGKLLIVLAIIVVVVGSIVLVTKLIGKNKVSEKENLTTQLENIGRNYYENYYYVSAGNTEEENGKEKYLSNFATVGLKINLENLLRYNNTLKDKNETKFVNSKTNENCNYEKSMVTIYPKSPYGKTDYTINVYLDCGFEE